MRYAYGVESIEAIAAVVAAGIAVVGAVWTAISRFNRLEAKIESLDRELKDARRDYEEKLNHQRELAELALSKHADKDDAILTELREHKQSCERNFARLFELMERDK